MKKVLLIHGYNGIPTIFEWLKDELEKMDYTVIMPVLPVQENVRYNIWKQEFNKYNYDLDQEIVVIAHSIGNSFVIKYLNESNLNITLYIGLAGFSDPFITPGKKDLDNAVKDLATSIEEINNFKNKVSIKYCIYSNDDYVVPFEVLKKHIRNINGIDYLIPGIGHMGKQSNLESLPQVLDIIKENSISN